MLTREQKLEALARLKNPPSSDMAMVLSHIQVLKGDKGDVGDDGHTPTNEEILALILPLIPDPIQGEKGDNPSRDELLSLIRPLIPKVEDGKTPVRGVDYMTPVDKREFLDEILSRIPQPKKEVSAEHVASLVEKRIKNPTTKEVVTAILADPYLRLLLRGGGSSSSSSSGTSLAVENPTGTVDDSNLTFTVVNTPIYIIVNGAQYVAGTGIFTSYSAPTITLSSPVGAGGFIRSFYAV